jgi:hypothetical protein
VDGTVLDRVTLALIIGTDVLYQIRVAGMGGRAINVHLFTLEELGMEGSQANEYPPGFVPAETYLA